MWVCLPDLFLIPPRPHGGVDSDLPQELLRYCRQIAFGMNYLSKIGFIHRDLAARNILIAEDRTCKVRNECIVHDCS